MATTLTQKEFQKRYGKRSLNRFGPVLSLSEQAAQKGIGERFEEISEQRGTEVIKSLERKEAGEQGLLRTVSQFGGQLLGGASDVLQLGAGRLFRALPDTLEEPLRKAGRGALESGAGQAVVQTLQGLDAKLGDLEKENPKLAGDIRAALGAAQFGADIAGAGAVGKGATATVKVTKESLEQATRSVSRSARNVINRVKIKTPELVDKALLQLADEPSEQVVTILKRSSKKNFDNFLEVAKKSAIDFEAPTGFEIVGDKLADAAKKINSQLRSIGKQKQSIIDRAKVGRVEFVAPARRAVLATSKLEKTSLTKNVIERLKTIKTKADADRIIDDIQELIFNAAGTKVIAPGSRIEKQLRGIIKKLNDELKEGLPTSYVRLNQTYADRIEALQKLNRSLGDTLEGVPLRGASLVKQFFSPSGRTAKELFDFVKKNTGIDLAEDVVLAKFTAELFGDPKVRSLLEGIPTGRRGIIEKGAEILAEKTGVGRSIRGKIKEGRVQKARNVIPN